ncbi:MAG: 8-amino-7-oxononanoate synthase [Alphaproteobacteria bacterium MarineAlpha11_Bin1]|nr:MAG: 8-amino-7-oxononanoate synthase [Alphaproteobacteria bacterium MarineAlpha11_Bin1]|tara:strand:- start:12684 stop:13871 length:1188 start_codon:yes stop_codon:yes gene_type:complete
MSNESLDKFAKLKLDRLMTSGLHRSLIATQRTDSVRLRRGGRDLISFCCNDYLGLSHHPKVKDAAAAAIAGYGAGAGASRLITGNHPLYAVLEHKLAALKGTEAACVFGSGYMANAGILPALAGVGDLILADELGHASINMGARAARAKFLTFRHNDVHDLADVLTRERASAGTCLVVTEGVFSMDGDRAPLDILAGVCADHDAWLMMDDAHGFGVLGGGRGSAFEFDPIPEIPLQMGTLSKAVGVYGAFLCASSPVIELMKNRARSLIYTTGLPPPVIAAAIEAVDIIETDPCRVARPLSLAREFCNGVGLEAPESPVVPIIFGTDSAALEASLALEMEGFLVAPIRPPTVPAGTSRLRFTFTAEHSEAQVTALAAAVNSLKLDYGNPFPMADG